MKVKQIVYFLWPSKNLVAILSKFTLLCLSFYFVIYFLKWKLSFFHNRIVYYFKWTFSIFLPHTHTHTLYIYIYIYIYIAQSAYCWECSPIIRKTSVKSYDESHQRLKKWYLISPYDALSIKWYRSRLIGAIQGRGILASLTYQCSGY